MIPDGITVVAEPVEPTIEGVDGLVGTRDQDTAEIQGSQPWAADVADPEQVTAAAESAFLADPAAVPDGMEVLPGSTTVTVGEGTIDGDSMRVDTTVSARAAPIVDPEVVRERVAGATAEEAEAELADIGQATVELWPGLGDHRSDHGRTGRGGGRGCRGRCPVSRLLGLDHGKRRIGVAIADSETGMAFARVAIQRRNLDHDLAVVGELCTTEGVGRIVIGLPLNMDGTEGPQAAEARAFGEGLAVARAGRRLRGRAAEQLGGIATPCRCGPSSGTREWRAGLGGCPPDPATISGRPAPAGPRRRGD